MYRLCGKPCVYSNVKNNISDRGLLGLLLVVGLGVVGHGGDWGL
jgi:hypothetical protein